MPTYIHELKEWPHFFWDAETLEKPLGNLRYRQGLLLGRMSSLGMAQQEQRSLDNLTLDVTKSSEIEGEILPTDQVRSSIARRLGLEMGGLVNSDRQVDGVVEVMVDATRMFNKPLTAERLFNWHRNLFPYGMSGMFSITVGDWRKDDKGPMQVVSGPLGREKVHFVAPDAGRVADEMDPFLLWVNEQNEVDSILRSAIAHFWFVTIHPFDDGNGRIARAIADMLLARSDQSAMRFYSMSSQIRNERNSYYQILENTQRGDLDITPWLLWYLSCLDKAISNSEGQMTIALAKNRFWERHRAHAFNSRQVIMLNKMLDGFDGKLTSAKWATITKVSHDTALRDITDLLGSGILKKDGAGGRNTGYDLVKDH
ncbi:MAG TPA: Fic family protein [Phnomibacter sp.]|nr:Fic family protein [Phnomibacter sp.]